MNKTRMFWLLCGLGLLLIAAAPDEGMYPISEILKLDLRAKGLKIEPKEIYNPEGVSLIDGIVQVGGCTGSFVSGEGLILTNHHCAFGAVQAASTTEHDYIANGFLARTKSEEIPAKGYTVRLTDSYRDVSAEVLSAVNDTMALAARSKAIEKKIKEIVAATEKDNPGKRAEVSEMFIGKSYVLFIYTHLKDVRLVYVPPRAIGEFGGEEDNWVWPRHTGDFSFLRAYVAPNGAPADYSPDNVPYVPRKHLKVAPQGANEEDFVFILGYPGSTFRHRTASYLAFEEEVRMPYIADLYAWQIATMEQLGKDDRGVALKHASRIKSLANVMKNYRGKLKGLKRLQLVEKKRLEEQALQNFITGDPARAKTYGAVLAELDKIYADMRAQAERELILGTLQSSSTMLRFGYALYEGTQELQKPDLERESPYMERNLNATKQSLKQAALNYYEPTDRIFLREMLLRAAKLPSEQSIPGIAGLLKEGAPKEGTPEKSIDKFLQAAYAKSKLAEEKFLLDALAQKPEQIAKLKDPFIEFARALYPSFKQLRETRQSRDGALSKLYAQLTDIKQLFLATDFIPDANRTLRLTFGRVRGYRPADAMYYHPVTTLKGVMEKTTGVEPFDTPQKLIDLYNAKDFGQFKLAQSGEVPVALLYNLDTTGGNSGSAVLNANGEIVGVNFDRAFEATINDYAWSEDYSRSIAVDIRYVLWVTQKFAGAQHLLDEMNVRGEEN